MGRGLVLYSVGIGFCGTWSCVVFCGDWVLWDVVLCCILWGLGSVGRGLMLYSVGIEFRGTWSCVIF